VERTGIEPVTSGLQSRTVAGIEYPGHPYNRRGNLNPRSISARAPTAATLVGLARTSEVS
jgi:hypothetical protein